jgi:hypothetical protein
VADGSASTPAFLDAIGAAGFGVLGGASFVADPAGARGGLLLGGEGAERGESTNQQEDKRNSAGDHCFLLVLSLVERLCGNLKINSSAAEARKKRHDFCRT